MKISVIVPAFNEERVIGGSLRSICSAMQAFQSLAWDTELIVCDNNSTDRTAEIAQSMGAAVVFERFNQISRARNTGAAHATGDWLLFVDADSWPSAELFADVARVIQDGRALAGGSIVQLDTRELLPRIAVGWWNITSRLMRWGAGSFIFCEAAAFRELHGFSLELFAAEEIDFFKRIKKMARLRRRSVEILRAHPLLTSARKARLYTPREAFRFMLKTVAQHGRTLRSRDECYQWYDGRR